MIDSLKGCSDAIFGIRQSIGADLKKVYLVERRWTGSRAGDGTCTDTETEVLPTPGIRDLSHRNAATEGGRAKEGPLTIFHISKNKFPSEADVNCKSEERNVEKFYRVGSELYRVTAIREHHLSWSVDVERLRDQRRP